MNIDYKAYGFLVPVSGLIVALDQWTKSIVESNLVFNETWMPLEWLRPYIRIVHWKNTGAAFGIGQGLNVFFMLLSVVVILVIIYYFPRIPRSDIFFKAALSMQLGGAIGNLIDRFTQGYVTDFISVGTFPVFNIADSCITVGVGVLLLGMWLEERDTQDE
ncbi:MAG: signal peptidase II [Anaerolineales bacterium]